VEQVSDAVVKAWNVRKPAGVSWGLGHAVVAHNRRAVYANGTAAMYGKTDRPEFRGIEGYEDHGIDVLCFWDAEKMTESRHQFEEAVRIDPEFTDGWVSLGYLRVRAGDTAGAEEAFLKRLVVFLDELVPVLLFRRDSG